MALGSPILAVPSQGFEVRFSVRTSGVEVDNGSHSEIFVTVIKGLFNASKETRCYCWYLTLINHKHIYHKAQRK